MEIVNAILQHGQTPQSITSILYHCSLSFNQARHYIQQLIERGMLERNIDLKYQTTDFGVEYMAGVKLICEIWRYRPNLLPIPPPLTPKLMEVD